MLETLKNRNAAVVAVLQAAGLAHLWSSEGPTPEAVRLRDDAAAEPTLRTWVRLGFELYDGSSGLTVSQLFANMEKPALTIALTRLVGVSMGAEGVQLMLQDAGGDPEDGSTLQ